MSKELFQILGWAVLAILILSRDVIAPLVKKVLKSNNPNNNPKNNPGHNPGNNPGENPVNIDRFHQEFIDFKDTQKDWNTKIEGKLDKITDLIIGRK